jgi:NAD(P)H-flavin reductase
MTLDHFLPHPARIAAIIPESADTRTFVLALDPPVPAFDAARAGQFAMLSLLGHGEAAFTLSSLPRAGAAPGTAVVTVRRVGHLTGALFALAPGARLGLRGPFGHGFPEDDPGRPTLYVAGGCGLAPLRAAIDAQIVARPAGTPLAIVYGAREPEARIHRAALAAWERTPGVHVIECVEQAGAGWRGRVGVVADFLSEAVALIGARRAAICGPPLMLPAVADCLCRSGLDAAEVHVAIERYMKCGTGHCGHCYVNHRYVCRDGPVFSWAELRRLPDAFLALAQPPAVAAAVC